MRRVGRRGQEEGGRGFRDSRGPRSGSRAGGTTGRGEVGRAACGSARAHTRAGARAAAATPVASLSRDRRCSRLGARRKIGQWAGVLSAGFEAGLRSPLPPGAWAALKSRDRGAAG